MNTILDAAGAAILIGTGATLVMDAWTIARRRMLGTRLPDYGLVGRWFAHMARGRFRHVAIAASPAVRFERAVGWIAHYLTGIAFAALLLAIWGSDWLRHPTIGPAMVVGLASVAAPFLVMQPGMGAGIAASRTPNPSAARLQSIVTHAVFGFGLYVAALAAALVQPLQSWR